MLPLLKNESFLRIFKNFISLVILNVVNYVFPIVIIPILISRLGFETYGEYIYSFTIISYLSLIVQYGFNISATRKIAKNSDNSRVISETYSAVTLIRLIFSIAIILCLVPAILIIGGNSTLYFYGVGIFLGQGLIPIWLFQGVEKMNLLTIVNTIVRIIAFVMIIFMVSSAENVNLLMQIQSLSFMVGAAISMVIVKCNLRISLVRVRVGIIKENLQEGWSLFLSTIGINLYRESSVVILGLLTNYSVVGVYSPAEKLIKGLQSFSNIIVTAIFPYFSRQIGENRNGGLNQLIKVGKLISVVFVVITIILYLLSSQIIELYLGNMYHINTILNFRILCFVLLFGGLNYYYGIVGLVALGYESLFNKLVWLSGLLGIGLCFLLSYLYADVGASIAMVAAELLLLILIITQIRKKT